jgi:hypothetical protein
LLLYTNSTKLLLKIDDDSFLNLPKLSKVLLQKSANDGTKKIFGSVNKHVLVFYPKGEEEKQEKYLRKWRIPTYLYNQTHYPRYINGGCYIMTYPAVECLLRISMDILYFHLEDVYLTGFTADVCNITREYVSGQLKLPMKINS